MLEKYSITLNIFGRQFPAKVDSEEAAVIKEAAQMIHLKMRAFKSEYRTQDDLDIAIMCCLEIMTDYLRHKKQERQMVQTAQEALEVLENQLDTTLKLSQ